MDKLKMIYIDSALGIIKGSLCVILQIPTGRTTESVKKKKNNDGILTVRSILTEPTINQYNDIRQLIKTKIEENSTFYNYQINRALAEKVYGESIYDNFGLAKEISEINLIILEEWNINCNKNRVLKHSGLIKNIEINKFKYVSNKESLEVHFVVNPKYTLEELNNIYKNEKELNSFLLSPIIKICNKRADEVDNGNKDSPFLYLYEEDILPKYKVLPPSESENGSYQKSKIVTPWEVNINEEGINYNKLIKEFGCSKISEEHIKKIEKLTNRKPHHFIRRGIFFSHRDLDFLLNYYEQHKYFYIYTGRGPSSYSMHLGHLIPFYFCKYLQDTFNVPLVIQISDDEKFLFNHNYSLDDINTFAMENVKDIIAIGFNPELTFIFKNTEYAKNLYSTALSISKKTTLNQSMNIFGFNNSDNIGKISYPSFQIAPCFSQCFPKFLKKNIPCLVPQGIDQDPYFRLSRDIAVKLALYKPVVIHSVFMPGLQGTNTKMSSTKKIDGKNKNSTQDVNNTVIFLTDTPEEIKNKINKYAFSGGGATVSEHREHGANLEKDICYQYLRYFLEDDEQLHTIGEKYKKGEMLSGEIKKILIDILSDLVQKHKKKRNSLTDEEVLYFFNDEKPYLAKFRDV